MEIKHHFETLFPLMKNRKTAFSISTTSKQISNREFFFTPVRVHEDVLLTGIVVQDISVLYELTKFLKFFDLILLDVEKKIFDRHGTAINLESIVRKGLGIQRDKIKSFKANDLTCDATFNFLNQINPVSSDTLSGKSCLVLGLGNIGFKLTLKLVEAGCSTFVYRRDTDKLEKLRDAINIAKPSATLASCAVFQPSSSSQKFDYIIGVSGSMAETYLFENIELKETVVVDIGKGSIPRHVLYELRKHGGRAYRLSVHSQMMSITLNHFYGVKEVPHENKMLGFTFVSGGYLGEFNSIVCDDAYNPKVLYGVADGVGDLRRDNDAAEILENVRTTLETSI